ncbi:pirin family protein [Blastococcus goldschmidtiae]|uniref:Pirin family protein n=1 Tax=Blastococcus goldschmidtiae TaxID=3075546 RepID=A0ABU2K7J3_9ACTN|nr:pirin family protein [Blastococcus sp. DSM 46792]MDT0276152.1 pirin family protein [Blastococcus sp. DSM 46792]
MSDVQVVTSREVPLGGPRAMTVRRTLPQRARSLVGAWCFADHYGPDDVARTGGMDVPPHPHTGLQTVSWLFSGEIEHRDTTGAHEIVRPGELNVMTGGSGVAHSEVSTRGSGTLHGVQLWTALPDAARDLPRSFVHHVPEVLHLAGATARVLLGTLAGCTSPVPTHSPLLGAELVVEPATEVVLDVAPEFEHGVLVDQGPVVLDGVALGRAELGYTSPGRRQLTLANPGNDHARVMLLGGEPFPDPVVMWWNFIGRTHEEIAGYREEWESGSPRFGRVEGYAGEVQRLPAPPLPTVRMKPRIAPPASGDPSAWG